MFNDVGTHNNNKHDYTDPISTQVYIYKYILLFNIPNKQNIYYILFRDGWTSFISTDGIIRI